MDTQLEHGALIQLLLKLYSRMAVFALNFRRGHGKHRAVRNFGGDVASPLHAYIDLVANQAPTRIKPDDNTAEKSVQTESPGDKPSQDDSIGTGKKPGGRPRALAKYFEGQKAATVLIPEVGKKMKNRTWEHLHEAIRYGRLGDIKDAKLHADLANATLKEAIQYMSRDEFEAFLAEIEKKFTDVLEESRRQDI